MSEYGHSFLTRPILVTKNERWADRSRMVFGDYEFCSGYYTLSWLGVINGCPILNKYWRLACTIDEDTKEILGWSIIKASRCISVLEVENE